MTNLMTTASSIDVVSSIMNVTNTSRALVVIDAVSGSSATVTITDPNTVSISAQTNAVEGSATPGVFRLSRTGSTAADLTLTTLSVALLLIPLTMPLCQVWRPLPQDRLLLM